VTSSDAKAIRVFDGVLDARSHALIDSYLNSGDWTYGGYSSEQAGASRYWYRHFAGVARSAAEAKDFDIFESELAANAPPIFQMWKTLQTFILPGHRLLRCYANAYPFGAEGACHVDSDRSDHFTAIYYPHQNWEPDFGGETVFFNDEHTDIVASTYPRPNRLVIFPGVIPHVARGVSRVCPVLRTTLMFKTAADGSVR
jgi:SM-20-related protein